MKLTSKHIITKVIGENIKDRRKELKITQVQLANNLGIDKQYMYKIEKGKVNLSIAYLYEISKALKVNVCNFLEGIPIIFFFMVLDIQ